MLGEGEPWPHEAAKAKNGGFAAYCVSAWGVPVYATAGVPTATLVHAGHVLAQWLDNDEDGDVDNPKIIEALVDPAPAAGLGLGRIVALYYCSSTLYRNC